MYNTIEDAQVAAFKMMQREKRIIHVVRLYGRYMLQRIVNLHNQEDLVGWIDLLGYWHTYGAQKAPSRPAPKPAMDPERNKALERIRKLLRHANDRAATAPEAQAFATKARALMTKYRVSAQELRVPA